MFSIIFPGLYVAYSTNFLMEHDIMRSFGVDNVNHLAWLVKTGNNYYHLLILLNGPSSEFKSLLWWYRLNMKGYICNQHINSQMIYNLDHLHPVSTELITIVQGSQILTAFMFFKSMIISQQYGCL